LQNFLGPDYITSLKINLANINKSYQEKLSVINKQEVKLQFYQKERSTLSKQLKKKQKELKETNSQLQSQREYLEEKMSENEKMKEQFELKQKEDEELIQELRKEI